MGIIMLLGIIMKALRYFLVEREGIFELCFACFARSRQDKTDRQQDRKQMCAEAIRNPHNHVQVLPHT